MKYTVIPASELTEDLTARWAEIQGAHPGLASPYFRPEFTQAVSAVRDDAFVGLMWEGNQVVGFFPFHRRHGGLGRPVGLGLSDYHGVVADSDASWTAEELMRACGLVRWEFDHLLGFQHQFATYHDGVSGSPVIDVSGNMEAFEALHNSSARKQIREVRRKAERLTEQMGPVTFRLHTSDSEILQQLFSWKSQQCRNTGTFDFFALDWCVNLVEHIHSIQNPDFGGILATLHAGETLAAVHFVMYSEHVWHSWFPAYNHDLGAFSPGSALLLELIAVASGAGVSYIDLGKGMSLYKKQVMTRSISVASGRVVLPSLRNRTLTARDALQQWGRRSRLRPLLRIPGQIMKNWERNGRYE